MPACRVITSNKLMSTQGQHFEEQGHCSENTCISTVRLEECTQFLDRRLLALSWFELRELFIHIHRIAESSQVIRDLMAECKVNGINITTPQQQKINKIYDFVMEHISMVSVNFPVCSEQQLQQWSIPQNLVVSSYLPSRSHLTSYQFKIKNKLKNLEDMLLSKKLENCKFRFSGKMTLLNRLKTSKVFDLHILKQEIITLSILLDDLSNYFDQYNDLLQYFELVKDYVHRPWQNIIVQASSLPDIDELQIALQNASESFKLYEESYDQARSSKYLVEVAVLKSQLAQVEDLILKTTMENLPVAQIVQSFVELSSASQAEQLSREHENIINSLVEMKKESLVKVLKERTTRHIEEAFRAYAIRLMHAFKYRPNCQYCDSDAEFCKESVWIEKVEHFNWGKYLGLIELWQEKYRDSESMMKESAFVDSYQTLQTARSMYNRSGSAYEKLLREFYVALKRHDRVLALVRDFKIRFNKIVERELCQHLLIL